MKRKRITKADEWPVSTLELLRIECQKLEAKQKEKADKLVAALSQPNRKQKGKRIKFETYSTATDGRTHHATCWTDHHDCAIARLADIRQYIDKVWKQAPPEVRKIKQILEGW